VVYGLLALVHEPRFLLARFCNCHAVL
jgi:hypothetical protein